MNQPTHDLSTSHRPAITRPADPMFDAFDGLQGIVRGALSLVAWIGGTDAAADNLELKETLDALRPQLDAAVSRRDAGEILDNGALCSIACDAAHLLASLMDPEDGVDLAALPQGAQDAANALLGKLWRVGLMDAYMIPGGRFGIWGACASN